MVATEIVPPLVTLLNSIVNGAGSPGASGGIGVTVVAPWPTTAGATTVSSRWLTPALALTAFDAVMSTSKLPVTVGVPAITPAASMFNPAGSPTAPKVVGLLVPVI